jgi:predicted metal-dependent phosphoesterase TrpH
MMPPRLVKTEFHCHTCYSKDSLVPIEKLSGTCQKKDIQRLIITDHNTIEGAIRAQRIDPERMVVGEEIMTQQGELLAFFVKELIPAGLLASKAIDLLRSQEAFISVSHPFDRLRSGHWEIDDLLNIAPLVDAIEIFNARCMDPKMNAQAGDFSKEHKLAGTVGSDSHTLREIGQATLILPEFYDAVTLKSALQVAQLRARLSGPWVHFYSSYAKWWKKRHPGGRS